MTLLTKVSLGTIRAECDKGSLQLQAAVSVNVKEKALSKYQSLRQSLQELSSISDWVDKGQTLSLHVTFFLNGELLRDDPRNVGFLQELKSSMRTAKARPLPGVLVSAYDVTVMESVGFRCD